MRALLATAGVLALAGMAAAASAGTVRPHTVRRNPGGPVDALAQDGRILAWLSGSGGRCNAVHVLTPHGVEAMPRPAAGSMTCRWDLADRHPLLALAGRAHAALWTLPESGSSPSAYVMTAHLGGDEVQLARVAHANDGTGWWLGAVAGSGRTLAYSVVDVEYVDKLGCLDGRSCKRRIAGGGIDVVSNGTASPLPGAGPALDLAAANGLLAYVPATAAAQDGTPAATAAAAVEVVDARTGAVSCSVRPRGLPLAIALAPRLLAVLTRSGRAERVTWYDAVSGRREGAVRVPRRTAAELAASNRLVVYRVGRSLRGIAIPAGRVRTLGRATTNAVGLALARGRLVWAENGRASGRVRALTVG